jgi:uncharacterized membrane protein YhaH (DUF805 family)
MGKPIFEGMFSFRTGRRNRKSYLLHILAFQVPCVVILGMAPQGPGFLWASALAGIILASGFAAATQRLRDIGKTGWMSLLYLIPLVNLMLFMDLATEPSNQGRNYYGPSPLSPA